VELKLSPPLKSVAALPCQVRVKSKWQIHLNIHISENNMHHVRWHRFLEFLFVYLFFLTDTDAIMSLLQYLFVALIIPFSYEDKRLAQH